ncbi:hypothetical protein [Deinococcus sp. Leaf326]|uniref:hypothetical protein n=1 Tax=Deinococcus sp. Leaf326 TaxID=1736338 RepID=UPI0006F3A66A|nr:hypothetical protein [Deinococcus sp. Leaf326]KQR08700.1 hypothetical protein ASF71_09175 [Deinococcus sp. Leaf326]
MRRLALLLLPTLSLASVAAAQAAPSLSVVLSTETLRGVPVVEGIFPADQLYKRDVRVRAYRLDDVLGRNVADLERLAAAGYTVTFRCSDGYAPKARLADLLGQGGLMAFADADAGEARWAPATYQDKPLNADAVGYYLNWPLGGAPQKPVPWGVVTLELKPGS